MDRTRWRDQLAQLAKAAVDGDARAALIRSYLFDAIGRQSPSVAVQLGDLWYFVPTGDHVGRHTFLAGGYEQEVMRAALDLVGGITGGPPLVGKTFVDIGANIGTSTIPAIMEFGALNAIAFEPASQNLRLLRSNIAANDLAERVTVIAAALSDHSGVQLLEIGEDNSGDCRIRFSKESGSLGEASWSTEQVTLMTFDDVIRERQVSMDDIGLVWMDTQGHEAHVLNGASALTESSVPVVIEYWPYGLRRANALDTLHTLLGKCYRVVIDVRAAMKGDSVDEIPSENVGVLAKRYNSSSYLEYTDLILIK